VVTTGLTRGDQIAVLSGLKEGDVVVSTGQTKLQSGGLLVVNNAILPSSDPNPSRTRIESPMNFTDIFVKKPVLATVVSLLILVIGLRAALSLPVRQYPRTENAVVTVTTAYYGADPDVWPDSSLSPWKTPSPRPMASTTSPRPAPTLFPQSRSICSSITITTARSPKSPARSARC